MNKKGFLALAGIFLALMMGVCLPFSNTVIKADAQESDRLTVEYSPDGVYIPIIRTEEGQAYKAEVFAKSDTEFTSPFSVDGNVTFYPESLGDFCIRYQMNDNGVETFVYKDLTVQDTTKPVLSLTLNDTYKLGETISLIPAIEDNTAEWATVTYQLTRNGALCTEKIESGRLTLEKGGEYRVMVTVTDAGGNRVWETFDFSVDSAQKGGDQTGLIIGLSVGGGVLVLAAGACVFFVIRKKNAAKREGGKDEKQQ